MTALNTYERLEATALWRPEGGTQKVEVIVSMGEATLLISDLHDKTLTHWSLPAVKRSNGTNERTAIYKPAHDTDELLEVDDETMIDAILRVQKAIERAKPRPGRLRTLVIGASTLIVAGLAIFWLPNALVRQAVTIVPDVTQNQIGDALLNRVKRLSGQPCGTPHGTKALRALQIRLNVLNAQGNISVVSSGVRVSHSLPGGKTLLNRSVVEDFDDPDILAGYVLAEQQRAADQDPLGHLLHEAGLQTTLRLLTRGSISDDVLDDYAENLLSHAQRPVDPADLIERFAAANVRLSPYAYAIDITGERTRELIEADQTRVPNPQTVLTDGNWVAVQDICGG
jgi:hypothetical protein